MKHTIFAALTFLWGCDANLGLPPIADIDTSVDMETDVGASMDLPPALGEPCSGPTECGEEAMCVGTSDGTFVCMAMCQNAYDLCPTGGVCLTLSGRPEFVCYTGGSTSAGNVCLTNIDCMSGLLCIGAQSQFFCAQACDANTPCGVGSFCSTLSSGASVCVRKVGQICESSGDCTEGLSCTTDSEGFRGVDPGFCTLTDCETTCPDLSVCVTLPDVPASTCLSSCQSDADCRFIRGWRCRDKSICITFDDPILCEGAMGASRACFPPEIP